MLEPLAPQRALVTPIKLVADFRAHSLHVRTGADRGQQRAVGERRAAVVSKPIFITPEPARAQKSDQVAQPGLDPRADEPATVGVRRQYGGAVGKTRARITNTDIRHECRVQHQASTRASRPSRGLLDVSER